MAYLRTIVVIVISLLAGGSGAADILQLADNSTIVVSADEAWEEPGKDILHFRGHFEIRTPNWRLTADQATVYGGLDKLQRIVAASADGGTPVHFLFHGSESDDVPDTVGEGQFLEYDKTINMLSLSGNATLVSGVRSMRSDRIQYDLVNQMFTADGGSGVHVTVDPTTVDPASSER